MVVAQSDLLSETTYGLNKLFENETVGILTCFLPACV